MVAGAHGYCGRLPVPSPWHFEAGYEAGLEVEVLLCQSREYWVTGVAPLCFYFFILTLSLPLSLP